MVCCNSLTLQSFARGRKLAPVQPSSSELSCSEGPTTPQGHVKETTRRAFDGCSSVVNLPQSHLHLEPSAPLVLTQGAAHGNSQYQSMGELTSTRNTGRQVHVGRAGCGRWWKGSTERRTNGLSCQTHTQQNNGSSGPWTRGNYGLWKGEDDSERRDGNGQELEKLSVGSVEASGGSFHVTGR